jgi:hypothetical protein
VTKSGAETGSVEPGERIRLFCALQLAEETVDCLAAWQARELLSGRIVPPGHLHVTLAFLGHRPAAELPAVAAELREASAGAGSIELRPLRYRETRSVGMVVLEDVGGAATALAEDVQARLERLGVYPPGGAPVAASHHGSAVQDAGRTLSRATEHMFDSCCPVSRLPFFARRRWSALRRT